MLKTSWGGGPRFLGGGLDKWHERAAFQRSAFGRSTAGNDVVATIFIRIFFSFFSPFFFSPSRPFLIEGVLGSKNLFSESWSQKPMGRHFSRPRRPFQGPLAASLDFAGGSMFLKEGACSDQKTYLAKVDQGSNNLFPDPVSHFGLSGRWGVAGGAALQAVSECPRRR